MHSVVWNFLYFNMLMDMYRSPSSVPDSRKLENFTESTSTTPAITIEDLRNTTNVTEINNSKTFSSDNGVCYNIFNRDVCFENFDSMVNDTRPVIFRPASPKDINTIFYFSLRLKYNYHKFDPTQLLFMKKIDNSKKKFKIFTHGYKSSAFARTSKLMVAELLRTDDTVVIVIDWSSGAAASYPQAVANIRVVAVQTALLIQNIMSELEVELSAFHVIGHSLGAHLMGYCGNYIREILNASLPRITALDAAGPFFQGMNPILRLDSTDADFIDVIHTDNHPLLGFPLTVGMEDPVGHLDFYPNGGKQQPECSYSSFICLHQRAGLLFIESIRQSCTFVGVACSSYEDFIAGECWDCDVPGTCAVMGYKSIPPQQQLIEHPKLFLTTNGNSPFCGFHYRITIHSSNHNTSWEHGGEFGIIGVELTGARYSTGEIQLSEKSTFHNRGSVFKKVIFTKDVGNLHSLSVVFYYPSSFFNPISWRIRNPTLYIHSFEVEQLYPQVKWTFCHRNVTMKSSLKYIFKPEKEC